MTWEWVAFTLVAGVFVLILAAIFAMMLDKTQRNRVAREEARARSTVEELQEALEAERRRVTQTGGHRARPAGSPPMQPPHAGIGGPFKGQDARSLEEATVAKHLGLTVEQLRTHIDRARTDPKD